MIESKVFFPFLRFHGVETGKKFYLAIKILVILASALVLYSFYLRAPEHNPSSLFSHYAGHLRSVSSDAKTPQSKSRSRSYGPITQEPVEVAESKHVAGRSKEELRYSQGIESFEREQSPGLGTSGRQQDHSVCEGKMVYIYKLPPEFNEDLVDKCGRVSDDWVPLCGNLRNHGYGPHVPTALNDTQIIHGLADLEPPHAWFRTEQFSLELIFHEKLRRGYSCLTQDPELASAFYIPYYAALDTAFTLFDPNLSERDRLTQRLIGWLSGNSAWVKFHGAKKHFMALGRIVWDFTREQKAAEGWGSALLTQKEFSNVTRLLIEKRPWVSEEFAIPYPTSFHPSSLQDMKLWQEKLRGRMTKQRPLLTSFIGSSSRGTAWSRALRAELAKKCEQVGAGTCKEYRCGDGYSGTIDCARNPEHVSALFLSSTFCLEPSGDSPTRKGIFDSLVAGCIPVFFTNSSAYTQYTWHLPQNGDLYSVYFDGEEVIHGHLDIFSALVHIANDTQRLHRMQEEIIRILPRIVYSLPADNHGKDLAFQDAFDVALENVLEGSRIPTS